MDKSKDILAHLEECIRRMPASDLKACITVAGIALHMLCDRWSEVMEAIDNMPEKTGDTHGTS